MMKTLVASISGLRNREYRISGFERNLCRAELPEIAIAMIQALQKSRPSINPPLKPM